MATIRATCSDCGDVHLTTAQVTVRIRRRDARGAYTFHCPDCGRMTVRPADRETLDLLVASGVPIDVWELPDELGGVLDRPPLNDADLASFVQLLDDDAAFEHAVAELLADGSDGASTA